MRASSRGRHLALEGFTSTLPLGVDRLRATRRYAQRNIAHCVALTSSRCGCPGGLILGTADPGGTLERLDPYDRQFATTLTLIVGKGGGGKTVTSILLALRFIAQGGRIYITDRSSTPDDRGATGGTGHYDTLLSLIPGARRVQLGTPHGAVICPWDVPDIEHLPDQKIEFLLALHALLIGDAHDSDGLVRTLDADEEALLRDAISNVYRRCAQRDERPREQLLIDALADRQDAGELSGANADKLQSLLLRLAPYGEHGTLRHIANEPTTVSDTAPLVLFDFTGLSDRLAPALTLAVADYVEWHVHRLRRRRVQGELDQHGPWAGKSQLIIEEGWKPLSSPAAGAWLNEYARRARHYALWLTFVTQFFRDFDSEHGRSLLVKPRDRAVPGQRTPRPRARPRLDRPQRHRHRRDHRAAQPKGLLLHALHDLQARPRRRANRPRGPRVLDRQLQPRARPTPPPRRAARHRRRRMAGTHAALRPRLARALLPPSQRGAMTRPRSNRSAGASAAS